MKKVCGLDIHKDSVFMCILFENGEKIEEKFGVLTPELDRLRETLINQGVGVIAMESTSIYWMPIWRILCSDFELKLVNPYFIKQLPGRKSDIRDAHWIALVLMKDLIKGSFVPDHTVQELRLLGRRIFYLNRNLQRSQQNIDLILQRCNIRISNYVSDLFGKCMQSVLQALVQGEKSPQRLCSLLHKMTINKHGTQTLQDALSGAMSETERMLLSQSLEETRAYMKDVESCKKMMEEICREYYQTEMEHLQTIPGVQKYSAMIILAEIGADMKMFLTASALVGWAGLKPRNDESAGKIKGRKILHGNKYLRMILIQCAWAAGRTKGSLFEKRFNYLSRRMNKNKALIANARKILVYIWNILDKNQPYLPKAA